MTTSSTDHPDPARPWTAHLMPAPDAPDPLDDWAHWADEPQDLPPMPAACGAYCLCDGGDPCEARSTTTEDGAPS